MKVAIYTCQPLSDLNHAWRSHTPCVTMVSLLTLAYHQCKARCQEISEITVSLMGLLFVDTVYAGVGDKQCTGLYIMDIINWATCLMWLTNCCLQAVDINCCSLWSDCRTRGFLRKVCSCTASQKILCFCRKICFMIVFTKCYSQFLVKSVEIRPQISTSLA